MMDMMEQKVSAGWSSLANKVARAGRHEATPVNGCFVNASVARGSTVVFPTLAAMAEKGKKAYAHDLVYGAMGNPNQYAVEALIADIEGGTECQAVGSGLTACALPLLAFSGTGDHILMSDSVYGPTRRFANTMLKRFGVQTTFFAPMAGKAEIEALIQPNTRLIVTESPGSHSFEVQDIPMIAEIAHRRNLRLVVDNTWGFGIFNAFKHGAHISVQALTKYAAGHSDVIAGAVTVASQDDWRCVRDGAIQLGLCASPDDSWLTMRGLRTLPVRLEKQSLHAYRIACWLQTLPSIARVLHPALPDCPGHEFWLRDFTGAGCLFGVALSEHISVDAMRAMIDSLEVFSIGASWGGYESLILPSTGMITRDIVDPALSGPSFRLQIGLEDPETLKEDLLQGLRRLD